MRQTATIVAAFLALAVSAGCESDETKSVRVAATESVTDSVALRAESTTTTIAVADPALVTTCVDFVQFAAFIGDVDMSNMWNAVNQDPVALEQACESMSAGELELLAERKADADEFMAASVTTLPPAPPTTASPPPPPPVVTQPPAPPTTKPAPPPAAPQPIVALPPPSDCNPNYEGACVPNASDVDCAGGTGNGPAYVSGPVYVIGSDVYGLDSNGDGIGCET